MIRETVLSGASLKTRPIKHELEKQLVQRACKGDAEAFGQLYELTVDRIYRYIYFRVSNDEAAEDLTSKVFLKAWEHLPHFRMGSVPFIAWLYTISHNMVIDYYRVTKPSTALDEALNLPDDHPLPDAETERRADIQMLRRAILQLTPEQQHVVTMKLLNGMSTEEVAARLRKSPGAIRAVQMRALQALAKIYEGKAPG
jgi:RNA polymerase sigma-70 factor (ECF subfamily)